MLVHLSMIFAGILPVVLYGPRHEPFHIVWLQLVFGAGFIVVTTVHELGHTLAAWALGLRFVALNIGPLTVVKDKWGHRHVRFEWSRLTGTAGYAAAVPVSEDHIRSNALLTVFAGPFASLNAGLLCWLVYLNLPGLGWEAYWGVPGILAVLFVADFVANLIPIGYSDGSMLLHLLFWTRHGQDLHAYHLAAKTHHDAAQSLVEQDFSAEVQLRRKALDQMLARGDAPSVRLGHSYQALAFAQMNHSQRNQAAANFQKSIEVFGRCRDADPIHEANSWKGLETIYRIRQNVDEALRAADAAIAAFEKVRARNLDRASAAGIALAIAELHADSRRYDSGLQEVELALTLLPEGPKHLVTKANMWRIRMRCEAGLGNAAQARTAALEAASLLRSPDIPDAERTHAVSAIGTLAATVWLAGAGDTSAELLRESIHKLENQGPSSRAVGLRMVLASALRREGRLEAAEAALPSESDIEPEQRRTLLEERPEIFAKTGRVAQAVADAREALTLVEREAEDNAIDVACAQANLAEVLLADGKVDEAEDLARRACGELIPRRHADAAGALVTLALIRNDESSMDLIEEAMALVRDAPLMESGTKSRALEELHRRLECEKFPGQTPVTQTFV